MGGDIVAQALLLVLRYEEPLPKSAVRYPPPELRWLRGYRCCTASPRMLLFDPDTP
jgi:hypothetical protein